MINLTRDEMMRQLQRQPQRQRRRCRTSPGTSLKWPEKGEQATRLEASQSSSSKLVKIGKEAKAKQFRWWSLAFLLASQLIIAHSNNRCLAASRGQPITAKLAEGQAGARVATWPINRSSGTRTFAYKDGDDLDNNNNNNNDSHADNGEPDSYNNNNNNNRPESNDELARRLLSAHPSQRNLRLLRKLEQRQLDYQICYPNSATRSTRSQMMEPEARASSSSEGARQRPTLANNRSKANQVSANLSNLSSSSSANFNFNSNNNNNNNGSSNSSNYRTNVVIKAFNYKLRLDLELNSNLFGPSFIQLHYLANGGQQISTQRIQNCYFHARSQLDANPQAIGAFRTCNGLSGIIHVNKESFVIHPFYDTSDLSTKHPHIIYRYQFDAAANQQQQQQQSSGEQISNGGNVRQCGSSRLHEWALRQYNKLTPPVSKIRLRRNCSTCDIDVGGNSSLRRTNELASSIAGHTSNVESTTATVNADTAKTVAISSEAAAAATTRLRLSKRDVSLTEKHIELALVLSQDMFDKRNSSSRLEVLHDAIQIVNCLDLYFRSANTRVALIYVETWAFGDQIEMSSDVKQTLYNFLEYSTRKLYKVSMDAAHLLTGGHAHPFDFNEMGMAIPDSICSTRAVSVSQEASVFEPFIAASTMAHMLGHNLGMEHDEVEASTSSMSVTSTTAAPESHAHPRTRPASGHRHHQESSSEQQEEHDDDEIKSRSAGLPPNFSDWTTGDEEEVRGGNTGNSASAQVTDDSTCRGNCLMNERFIYLQPPVSIGNMIQQQVATGSSASSAMLNQSSQAIVTMYSSSSGGGYNQSSSGSVDGSSVSSELAGEAGAAEQHVATSLPYRFSRQSIETYHRQLRLGHGICLFNKPNQLEDFRTCGNGIVDKGEDCDCGTFQECLEQDSCCDPITCRFKADAECINGACCDRCKLRPRGFTCRKARGECDLPEQCDGKSSQCAPDVHKQNGLTCSQGAGYCYLGQCPQHDVQCSELWGSDARRADKVCYSTFNANGTIRGNCGFDATLRKYKRCEQDHLMCGTLHCQLGDMKPVTVDATAAQLASSLDATSLAPTTSATVHEFSKKTLHTLEGSHHECKVITGSFGQTTLANSHNTNNPTSSSSSSSSTSSASLSYVRDGSKCAQNKVCFNQTCQALESVYRETYELCPRDERLRFCSDNGICSTANRCHCNSGWTGHDCSQRVVVASPSSPEHLSTVAPSLYVPQPGPLNMLGGVAVGEQTLNSRLKPLPAVAVKTAAAAAAFLPESTSGSHHSEVVAVIATTIVPPTTAPVTTSPSSASSFSQENKKHDALGAPTLVFILVSIVAAVYVGFALMANCYRRKGFLKPDKVLRHHQMNCKLDAIRSSFIARRLAEAELGINGAGRNSGGGDSGAAIAVSTPGAQQAPLTGNATIPNGQPSDQLLNSYSVGSPVATCQHLSAIYGTAADAATASDQLLNSAALNQQSLPRSANQQISATVHYFDELGAPVDARNCVLHQRNEQLAYEAEQDDHIPLLLPVDSALRNKRLLTNRPLLSTFNSNPFITNQRQQQQHQVANKSTNRQPPTNWPNGIVGRTIQLQMRRPLAGTSATTCHPNLTSNHINRAISLGSVNHLRQNPHLQEQSANNNRVTDYEAEDADDEETRRVLMNHRALATPLRSAVGGHRSAASGGYRRANADVDSCSAPSSPEPRDACWSDAEQRLPDRPGPGYARQNIPRQSTTANPQQQPTPAGGYHEDVILGAISMSQQLKQQQQLQRRSITGSTQYMTSSCVGKSRMSRQQSLEQEPQNNAAQDDTEEDLPLLPPPPPPHLHDGGVEAESEDDSEYHVNQRPISRAANLPKSPVYPVVGSLRTVKRVPLNTGEQSAGGHTPVFEQLSLIAQLQQLERVQSLHQKQVASDKGFATANTNDGLHEFFSLPLSVQLSALLARSLNEDRLGQTANSTPLEDYLNNLNNTGVANSSRRSFKRSGGSQSKEQPLQQQQQQQSGSWGKRQQVKLQNLQGLINRLQKLHQQTMLQQQLEELNGYDLDEDCISAAVAGKSSSRYSTLSRSTRARSVSRANQTADDFYKEQQQNQVSTATDRDWNRSTGRARRTVRDNLVGSKNESVYSMSDSEDGKFVSQMLIYQQQSKIQTIEVNQQQPQQQQQQSKGQVSVDQPSVVSANPNRAVSEENQSDGDHRRKSSTSTNADPPSIWTPNQTVQIPINYPNNQEATEQSSSDKLDAKIIAKEQNEQNQEKLNN